MMATYDDNRRLVFFPFLSCDRFNCSFKGLDRHSARPTRRIATVGRHNGSLEFGQIHVVGGGDVVHSRVHVLVYVAPTIEEIGFLLDRFYDSLANSLGPLVLGKDTAR